MKMDVVLISLEGFGNKKMAGLICHISRSSFGVLLQSGVVPRDCCLAEGALCQLGCRYSPTGTQKDDWSSSYQHVSFTSIIIYLAT